MTDTPTAKLNVKAAELRSKLFELVNEFKDLQLAFHALPGEAAEEAAGQVDAVACELAGIHDRLPPVFVEAYS